MHRFCLVVTAVLIVESLVAHGVLFAASPVSAAPAYTVTEVGRVYPRAINASGEVVGNYTVSKSDSHAFSWQDGALRDLGTLSGQLSGASSVNAAGQITGASSYLDDPKKPYEHAFLWSDGAMRDLGALPGGSVAQGQSVGHAINNAGDVVGDSSVADQPHAVLWHGGTMTDLGTLGGDMSFGNAINDAGQVVGDLWPDAKRRTIRPFLWENGAIRDLGTLPGFTGASATAINVAGQIVGRATNNQPGVAERAVLWQGGTITDLGLLPGDISSTAVGINAFGQVVGNSSNFNGHSGTFLWHNGVLEDLSTLAGRPIDVVWGINDAGQIVASTGSDAFLLTPTGPTSQYFAPTGKTVSGPFLAYWEQHGGLAINGYPISDPFVETLEDGTPHLVQYFERVRLEYHPEAADPQYQMLLGQFGRRIHGGADPAVAAIPGATYFAETGHNVTRPEFAAYWQAHGGLAQFGYPLTEEFTETLGDGNSYIVQYFERARFEWHPENGDPYRVLLGQFGRQILGGH
jgi:probable HAF family extracellular repeat protein